MPAEMLRESDSEIVIQITIPKSNNFYECEENIRRGLNEGGTLATSKCLEEFDTDGSPILVGNQKLTAKRTKIPKKYETPYGISEVERYAYQSPEGGAVYIPLESNARIIGGSTPLLAKSVSYLYANNNAAVTKSSLKHTTGRIVSRCYVQDISAIVSEQVEATIAFYDATGERLHTNYVAAAPEHGKATFIQRMDEEIARVKSKYGSARYAGISDGATDYLPWLKKHTTTQILDFWHVTEYMAEAAGAIHRTKVKRTDWLDKNCHALKHQEFEGASEKGNLPAGVREKLEAAISYFGNNLNRMNYASYRKTKLPIGSGITEAACKVKPDPKWCSPCER